MGVTRAKGTAETTGERVNSDGDKVDSRNSLRWVSRTPNAHDTDRHQKSSIKAGRASGSGSAESPPARACDLGTSPSPSRSPNMTRPDPTSRSHSLSGSNFAVAFAWPFLCLTRTPARDGLTAACEVDCTLPAGAGVEVFGVWDMQWAGSVVCGLFEVWYWVVWCGRLWTALRCSE